MIPKVIPLIAAYSVVGGIILVGNAYSTQSLATVYRFSILLVNFCFLIALASLHIRSTIGNKITYLIACICSISISVLTLALTLVLGIVVEKQHFPVLIFLKLWGISSVAAVIPCLIISIFFRRSEKVVVFKDSDRSSEILDADLT
jgi:hypothetical protein